MSEDWLDTAPEGTLPAVVELPVALADRMALVEAAWSKLSLAQKTFLTALRSCGFNARAATRKLGHGDYTYSPHTKWKGDPNYALVMRVWLAIESGEALDKDRLLVRQDAIVEQLLEPKPILYMGAPTGFEENQAGAAARANETLMKAAGLLKDREIELNFGVAVNNGPPTLEIKVLPLAEVVAKKDERVVIDAEFTEVPSDDWLDGP